MIIVVPTLEPFMPLAAPIFWDDVITGKRRWVVSTMDVSHHLGNDSCLYPPGKLPDGVRVWFEDEPAAYAAMWAYYQAYNESFPYMKKWSRAINKSLGDIEISLTVESEVMEF